MYWLRIYGAAGGLRRGTIHTLMCSLIQAHDYCVRYVLSVYLFVYACMCVFRYVRMPACLSVCMYVCMYVHMYVRTYVCTSVCIHTYTIKLVPMRVRMHSCMHECMHVCMYLSIYIHIFVMSAQTPARTHRADLFLFQMQACMHARSCKNV